MLYAQINEENICVGISNLKGEINDINMIRINTFDTTLLGKKYNKGVWEEVPQPIPEPQPYQPTNAEIAQLISNLQADIEIRGL